MNEDRDYGSHAPVLKAILAQDKPKTVLEFGAGLFSTPLFLERPELVRLVSIEPDPHWRDVVSQHCWDWRLTLRPNLDVDPADFDLVFIDNGECSADRLEVLHIVLHPDHPLTVIHDADVPEYLTAIKDLAMNYAVIETDPPTAVCW